MNELNFSLPIGESGVFFKLLRFFSYLNAREWKDSKLHVSPLVACRMNDEIDSSPKWEEGLEGKIIQKYECKPIEWPLVINTRWGSLPIFKDESFVDFECRLSKQQQEK